MQRGEKNTNAKLNADDVRQIRSLYEYRETEIDNLNAAISDIERELRELKMKKQQLKRELNYKQIAMKFDVKECAVIKICQFQTWIHVK